MNKIKFYKIIIFLFVFISQKSSAEITISAEHIILQDYHSEKILFERGSDDKIYPASMTKIMTSIIAFDLLKEGSLSLEDKFIISEKAWRLSQPGYSSMFIVVGDEVSVENLLKGIIIVSGNDACIALAEGIAGSEEAFATLMTSKALEIGMTNTNFTNASGINDPDNYSTVRDILIMSDYLIRNYPDLYKYFKELEFTWDRTGGDPITQPNTNALLNKNKSVDGIKTGFLTVEKYSLASSIIKNNRRLIAVGSGFNTKSSRTYESNKLLNYGLSKFDTIQITKKNEKIDELDVWLGKKDKIGVYINEDFYITIPKVESLYKKKNLKAVLKYNGPILAPIKKGDIVGKFRVFYKDNLINEHNLYATEDIKKVNIFSRILKSINFIVWGDV